MYYCHHYYYQVVFWTTSVVQKAKEFWKQLFRLVLDCVFLFSLPGVLDILLVGLCVCLFYKISHALDCVIVHGWCIKFKIIKLKKIHHSMCCTVSLRVYTKKIWWEQILLAQEEKKCQWNDGCGYTLKYVASLIGFNGNELKTNCYVLKLNTLLCLESTGFMIKNDHPKEHYRGFVTYDNVNDKTIILVIESIIWYLCVVSITQYDRISILSCLSKFSFSKIATKIRSVGTGNELINIEYKFPKVLKRHMQYMRLVVIYSGEMAGEILIMEKVLYGLKNSWDTFQ